MFTKETQLNKNEASCVVANHEDADLGVQVWHWVNKRVEGGFGLKVAWVEAHPTKRSG